MEKIKVILLLLALMGTATATTIKLSNNSAEYEICVFDGLGKSYGCATNNATANFSRIDPVWYLKFKDQDYISKPATLLNLLPTFLYMGVFLIIALLISYAVVKIFVRPK